MADHGGLRTQERKVATVLFADIAGSTALGERLDIEPLGQVMGAFQRAVREAVERCDGSAEFVGDGVVAIFGAPRATEDHQGRALTAADLILDAIDQLNQRLVDRFGVSLGVRIGINTGEVLVDPSLDLRLGALAGDTFNVAARLEQSAGVGEVWASERTASAVGGRAMVDLGSLQVAGRERPVRAFRVGRAGTGGERPGRPALVGRQRELAVLAAAFDAVQSDGASRVVTVLGEAGIGKSALLDAFIEQVVRPLGANVASGACRAFGKAGALAPISRLLESALESPPDHDRLVRLLGADSDREASVLSRALGFDGTDGPAADAPGQAARDLAAAWRSVVAALTSGDPWVFTVEDLHWADPEALDLLRAVPSYARRGVLLVTTARPELEGSDHWPLEPTAGEVLELPALDREATGELAVQVDPQVGRVPAYAGALHRLTEGNPFFVVELIRSISERSGVDGIAPLTERGIGIPDTVQGVLADRIDRLEADAKRVLQVASVIGREFFPEAVAFLLDLDTHGVSEIIEQLIERGMVEVAPDHLAPYRFVHALTRDVAYGSMPRRDLHGLHETIADWLEAHPDAYEGDPATVIAFHLGQACQSLEADWEASEEHVTSVERRWVDWTIRAARRAIDATGFTEARRLARVAIEQAADDRQRVDAMECLGNAHFYGYEGDAAWETLTEAADLAFAGELRAPEELAALYIRALESPVRWAGGMRHPPSPTELRARIVRAQELLPSGDSVERVRLLTVIGFWPYATVGHPDSDLIGLEEARAAAEEAADMAQRIGRIDLESAALDGLGSTHIFRGDYAAADEVVRRRCGLYEALVDPWEKGDMCAVTAWVAFHRARYTEAIEWAGRGIDEFEGDYPSIGLHCRDWRGLARLRLGDWDGLLEDLAVVESAAGGGLPAPYATPLVAAGALVNHLRGDEGECDRLLRVLEASDHSGDVEGTDPLLARWAEYSAPILARRGDVDRAVDLIDRTTYRTASRMGQLLLARCLVVVEAAAWEQADEVVAACRRQSSELGTPVVDVGAWLVEAGRHAALGRWDSALAAADQAHRLAEHQSDRWLTGLAELGLAEAAFRLGDQDGARGHRERAADIFTRLGSVRELRRAHQLPGAR
jgi:class 3 adenylate cyclase/tetratricopeptide (TPR) repeat protein